MTLFQVSTILMILAGAILAWAQEMGMLIALVVFYFVIFGLGVATPEWRFFGPFLCAAPEPRKRKCVALTFDDGPDPRSTPRLLEILRAANVKAAFFCIGKNVEAHPELAAQIVREGHLLGNHTFSHSNFTNFFPVARLQREMADTQKIIEKSAGVTPVYFRPPMGLSNPGTFRAAKNLGLQVIGWTIRSLDTVTADPRKIVARIQSKLHFGAIILLHDGNIPADKLEATVKSLLDTLSGVGYEMVRLDELLK